MADVGVRELKSRLSHYLRRVRAGERLLVTERGEPVAVLSAAPDGHIDQRIEELLRNGVAQWGGGKPRGARKAPKVAGPTVAEAVVEDRR